MRLWLLNATMDSLLCRLMDKGLAVKARIPHTWPLFFARHGRFTPVQLQAIPPILDGKDTLVIAPTASGKTEAVIAPLVERFWSQLNRPDEHGVTILYICPTRALVRDLYVRLQTALADSDILVLMKTGDTSALNKERPFSILITTPESTDSLLTRVPRLFSSLRAIVLDEIHLFDDTPRGDHVRCLLPRIDRIREYAYPESNLPQRIALSATVPDPVGVAKRYLRKGVVIELPGGREIVADVVPLYDLTELVAALAQRRAQKSLVFCNTRAEAEETAVYLRQNLPHHAEVFVHYSNLDAAMRQDVETRFAETAVAICVSTSTLELGIDIGSVDDVVLLGAPFNLTSFMQRIGRGGRRTEQTRVLCMPHSPQEWARFEALLALANAPREKRVSSIAYAFRPAILIQQIFSMIKQSPTGSVRIADIRRIAPPEISSEDIRRILSNLSFARYIQSGRLGEWKPDSELQELLDRHDIYSNIGAQPLTATAVDAYTGRTIAQTDRLYKKGTVVLFGGRPMVVKWVDKYRFGLGPSPRDTVDDILRFQKAGVAIPYDISQAIASGLNLQTGQMALLPDDNGVWLFHFWGTIWGELLTAVLQAHHLIAEAVNEHCLFLRQSLDKLPPWDNAIAANVAQKRALALAARLEMGRFQKLLPPDVAVPAIVRRFNLAEFGRIYQTVQLVVPADIREQLTILTG